MRIVLFRRVSVMSVIVFEVCVVFFSFCWGLVFFWIFLGFS